jgi:uncharacterized protein (DUF1501 family)
MVGCSAAIAAMAGSRIGSLAFAQENELLPDAAGADHTLVVVFLRGGCDGLSLISPYDDPNYLSARRSSNSWQNLALDPATALPLTPNNPTYGSSSFGLHPGATGLKGLYDSGELAIVHACGLNNDTRSHFDAMDYIERGTPGNKSTSTGWLTRHLQSITGDDNATLPALSVGSSAAAALLSDPRAIAMNNPQSYSLSAPWRFGPEASNTRLRDAVLNALGGMYSGSGLLRVTGQRTIEGIRALRNMPDYTATYPNTDFARSLRMVAQMIDRADLGLRVATVDLGGWDHHESQGVNGGTYATLVGVLSEGLAAFYGDLKTKGHAGRVTVVVMSEFGRRLGRNLSNGTDHGHGGIMLLMGGKVRGGKVYGSWPGLADLDRDEDLRITTDFRTVLGEAVVRVLGNSKLGTVFPGVTPEIYSTQTALNIFQGQDPAQIDYTGGSFSVNIPLVSR